MWRSKSSRLPGSRVGCEIYVLRLCQTCLSFRLYSHWTSLTRCQTFGVARSYFINVWCLGTIASPLTAIEVIPVLPECLRSFFTKYKQDNTARIVLVFTWRASLTNLCLHVLLLDQVAFSITEALTPGICGQELLLGWYRLCKFCFVFICCQQFVHFNSGENFDL